MSERLTDLIVGKENEYCSFIANEIQVINKLGKLEDVLEKYDIATVEELDGVLKPLIENGELENWKSSIFWKTQTEKMKIHWNKLKEFLNKELAFDNDEVRDFPLAPNRHYITVEKIILEKMQELEKESEDEE